jgi:hypothetical protein
VMGVFFTRPISIILIILTITSAAWPLIQKLLGGGGKHAKR